VLRITEFSFCEELSKAGEMQFYHPANR